MSPDTIATLAGMAVIVAFLWSLHRDVAGIRERMSKLEGTVDVLVRFLIDRERGREAKP